MDRLSVIAIVLYLVFMNVFTFLLCGVDKLKAQRGSYRISEKTLFTFSILGGSAGMLIGMLLFRHKTKHLSFVFGIPFILVVQLCLVALILYENGINPVTLLGK